MFTFFYGVASGSSRKALRQLEEPNLMLSYQTKNNQKIDWADQLFIDSGAFSVLQNHPDYQTSHEEYLDYIEMQDPEFWALRDYVCPPDLKSGDESHKEMVKRHQEASTENYYQLLEMARDRGTPGQPVATIQGWKKNQYLNHLEQLEERGLLTETVGIGSLVGRGTGQDIRDIITAVRDHLPSKYNIHAFGVKASLLKYEEVREAVDSADSLNWERQSQYEAYDAGITKDFRTDAKFYLDDKFTIRKIKSDKEFNLKEGQKQLENF